MERLTPNGSDAIRDGDAARQAGTITTIRFIARNDSDSTFKSNTMTKCIIPNGNGGRDGHAGQTGVRERIFPNGSDAIADGDAGQFGTTLERLTPNGSDAIADGDAGQFGTTLERIRRDSCWVSDDAIADGDAGQTVTTIEIIFCEAIADDDQCR